ncbi:hypothetical protein RJT34_10692 [Clitoria ternatea]|uniref:Uncharacterized protein n=1 Tax=Clitoria ternatea TaxID=43366 RepID=A0AAN9JKG9_CLITE
MLVTVSLTSINLLVKNSFNERLKPILSPTTSMQIQKEIKKTVVFIECCLSHQNFQLGFCLECSIVASSPQWEFICTP